VIVDFFFATTTGDVEEPASALAEGFALGVGVAATADTSCVNFTFRVGEEKVKPAALR